MRNIFNVPPSALLELAERTAAGVPAPAPKSPRSGEILRRRFGNRSFPARYLDGARRCWELFEEKNPHIMAIIISRNHTFCLNFERYEVNGGLREKESTRYPK